VLAASFKLQAASCKGFPHQKCFSFCGTPQVVLMFFFALKQKRTKKVQACPTATACGGTRPRGQAARAHEETLGFETWLRHGRACFYFKGGIPCGGASIPLLILQQYAS
jgi:hypothetical protein